MDLGSFYASRQGRMARRLIGQALRGLWPDVRGCRVAGLGYAPPFLRPFQAEAERVIALMPAGMGARRWPAHQPCLASVVDERWLPLPDRSVDRLLLVHALEYTCSLREVLRECWRVLTDDGRLVVVVPNRTGLWARLEHSPFASGRPFSQGQLEKLLHDSLFTPVHSSTALFLPPVTGRALLGSAATAERLGRRWCRGFGGVVVTESMKEIAAPVLRPTPARSVRLSLASPLRGSSRGMP